MNKQTSTNRDIEGTVHIFSSQNLKEKIPVIDAAFMT